MRASVAVVNAKEMKSLRDLALWTEKRRMNRDGIFHIPSTAANRRHSKFRKVLLQNETQIGTQIRFLLRLGVYASIVSLRRHPGLLTLAAVGSRRRDGIGDELEPSDLHPPAPRRSSVRLVLRRRFAFAHHITTRLHHGYIYKYIVRFRPSTKSKKLQRYRKSTIRESQVLETLLSLYS